MACEPSLLLRFQRWPSITAENQPSGVLLSSLDDTRSFQGPIVDALNSSSLQPPQLKRRRTDCDRGPPVTEARSCPSVMPHAGGRLFQQFCVDIFTRIEAERTVSSPTRVRVAISFFRYTIPPSPLHNSPKAQGAIRFKLD